MQVSEKQRYLSSPRLSLMPHLLRDLRYACRGLLRAPLFTIVAVASIALDRRKHSNLYAG
jgi:hypothetical protein